MADDINLVARLRAYAVGRAQPIATHLQVAVRPEALVVCPIAMSGEDTSVHIMAVGQIGESPEIWCVPDPRLRDDQDGLFLALGDRLEIYFEQSRMAGTYPQLWVSSSAAAGHLDILADRLRFNKRDPRLKRCGELLAYATERFPVAGQQALQVATSALTTHWATGQQTAEDEHLATVLTWIAPPAGMNTLAVVSARERIPMGIHTDPTFDRTTLLPLVTAYNGARKEGASARELTAREKAIRAVLEPVVVKIYKVVQRAILLLRRLSLPPLPDLSTMELREADEFASFMASRDAGYPIPLRDKPKSAAFRISAREEAIQNVNASILVGDRIARARGRLNGRITSGVVRNPRRIHLGPRRFEWHFELISDQPTLRVRLRDELRSVADPRLRVLVTGAERIPGGTRIGLQVLTGQRAVGIPEEGEELELAEAVPQWDGLIRLRKHLKTRLEITPWTHQEGPVPVLSPRTCPADPLAAVEALQ